MIDLEKEKEAFVKVYTEIYGEHDQLWQGWKKRAELAQAEITELKQKLEKLESGEFILVPREPTKRMITVGHGYWLPKDVYKAMIEVGASQ